MNNINVKVDLITNYMESEKISKSEFCKMCKISYSTLEKIVDGRCDFRITAIFKISQVLGVSMFDMLE